MVMFIALYWSSDWLLDAFLSTLFRYYSTVIILIPQVSINTRNTPQVQSALFDLKDERSSADMLIVFPSCLFVWINNFTPRSIIPPVFLKHSNFNVQRFYIKLHFFCQYLCIQCWYLLASCYQQDVIFCCSSSRLLLWATLRYFGIAQQHIVRLPPIPLAVCYVGAILCIHESPLSVALPCHASCQHPTCTAPS